MATNSLRFQPPRKKTHFTGRLLSNDLDTPLPKLFAVAMQRWKIENAFRLAKQEAGLMDYEGRKYRGLIRHLTMGLVVLAFVAFLAWTTVSAQKAECHVCVEFAKGRNCATASGADERSAAQGAQTTACGPLANGMDATIACENIPPTIRQCRSR